MSRGLDIRMAGYFLNGKKLDRADLDNYIKRLEQQLAELKIIINYIKENDPDAYEWAKDHVKK